MAHRLQFIMSVATAMAAVTVVQPAVAETTQINQVQINTVNGALEVRLETAGGIPETHIPQVRFQNKVI